MMPVRLGQKLNAALFIFLLIVGLATAVQVYFAFDRAQNRASNISREGLEEAGRTNMLSLAQSQADFAVLQMEWASEAAFHAANYFVQHRRIGGGVPFDAGRLVRGSGGQLYDPSAERRSDVVMPSIAPVTPAALQDISDSAALDALFPVLMTGEPGRERDSNFDGVGIGYVSNNGVARYYPPIGLADIAPPDVNFAPLLLAIGPERNPARKSIWTDLYVDTAGQGLVITAYAPIYDGDSYLGVVGVDLAVARLVDQVGQLKPSPGGFAFYMDYSGDFLPSEFVPMLQRELLDPSNTALQSVVAGMKAGQRAVERVHLDGREVFIGYSPMASIGGSLGVVAPVEEITIGAASVASSIDREGDRTMIGLLAGMVFYFGVGLIIASWLGRRLILRPITALVLGTRSVAQGNLATSLEVKGRDEMADLAHSFNEMTAEMRQRRAALEAEVVERQAAQDELRALFASMTDVVFVFDGNGNFLRVPPTAAPNLTMPLEAYIGRNLHDVLDPEQASLILDHITKALSERETQVFEVPISADGRTVWYSVAVSPMAANQVVVVSRDITERVEAAQELEHRVEDRTRELSTIVEISKDVSSTLELGRLLDLIIGHLRQIVDFRRTSVLMLEDDSFVLLDSRDNAGAPPQFNLRFRIQDVPSLWEEVRNGRPVIIPNVRDGSEFAQGYRRVTGPLFETTFKDTHSMIVAPLAIKDRIIGLMTVSHTEPDHFTQHHAELLTAIASHAAVAIENARLYEDVQRYARETEALLQADAELFRSLSLETVLQALVDVTVDVMMADKSILALGDDRRQRVRASRNFSDAGFATISELLSSIEWDSSSGNPEPFVMGDNQDDPRKEVREMCQVEGIRRCMVVPIVSGGRVIGAYLAAYQSEHDFSDSERRVFVALGERGAVAIQNAELFARAQQAASLEERQRLARELHDSVSQALYGIALGASTAQEALSGSDPISAREPVDYVLSLAQAGLAEMRALIFELRPESLEIEGLVAAIDKHVAATRSRYGLEVDADLEGEPDIALPVKEVYYRITQEALHNVVKHAGATHVDVSLSANGQGVVLEIKDNGIGFDADQSYPGHLGLVSMAERASSVGAELQVTSASGSGTTVRLSLPRPPHE